MVFLLPVDQPEGAIFHEPGRSYGQKVLVVRYENKVLLGCVFEEHIVVFILSECIYSSLYLPATLEESSYETSIDVGVREQRKAWHDLGLARPVYRSCDMAVFRSRLFRWLAAVALSVFLPLTLELFRGAFLGLNRRVDFIFTLVVVGQGRVDLCQI